MSNHEIPCPFCHEDLRVHAHSEIRCGERYKAAEQYRQGGDRMRLWSACSAVRAAAVDRQEISFSSDEWSVILSAMTQCKGSQHAPLLPLINRLCEFLGRPRYWPPDIAPDKRGSQS